MNVLEMHNGLNKLKISLFNAKLNSVSQEIFFFTDFQFFNFCWSQNYFSLSWSTTLLLFLVQVQKLVSNQFKEPSINRKVYLSNKVKFVHQFTRVFRKGVRIKKSKLPQCKAPLMGSQNWNPMLKISFKKHFPQAKVFEHFPM